jgi:hypothetical protein
MAFRGRISVSILGQIGVLAEKVAFCMDCGGEIGILTGFWFKTFYYTGVFVNKLPFYRGFGGENCILQGFPKYFPFTLPVFHIYLFIYRGTI